MASWRQVEQEVPELAAAARRFLEAHPHKTIATLRADGSPRICGNEATFHRGELWLGMMTGAARVRDLQRDARMALHSASEHPDQWRGDAKVSGRAMEVTDPEEVAAYLDGLDGQPPGDFHLFRVEVEELVVVEMGEPADHLLVQWWSPGKGLRSRRRG